MDAIIEHLGRLINPGNPFEPAKVRCNCAFRCPYNGIVDGDLHMCPDAILPCSHIKHDTNGLFRW